jgi:acetyltransferase
MHIVTRVSPSRRSIARIRNDPGHPAPEAVPVPLPGGRVVALRPLRRGERDTLLAVFDGMSSASRARRYLTGMVRLPSTVLEALIDVDGHRHVAWVASEHGQPVGIARLVLDAAGVADLAVEVVDAYHGLGIGSALVDAVTTVAGTREVRRVRASLTPDNEPSKRLVTRIGVRLRVVDGLLEGEGRLQLLHPPRIDRRAALALAARVADEQRDAHSTARLHCASTMPQRPPPRLVNDSYPREEAPCPPPTSITPRS